MEHYISYQAGTQSLVLRHVPRRVGLVKAVGWRLDALTGHRWCNSWMMRRVDLWEEATARDFSVPLDGPETARALAAFMWPKYQPEEDQ